MQFIQSILPDFSHPEKWSFLAGMLANFLVHAGAAGLILLTGWWAARRASRWLDYFFTARSRVDSTLRPVLCELGLWAVRIMAVILALSQLGIETASIVAALGAAGLAIGLALQGTMQNIAAGVMLLLLRPFTAGDYIESGTGAIAGTVDAISLFTTRMTRSDGICEFVPNNALWNSSIRNYHHNSTRRLDLEVEISVHDDINRALDALRVLIMADPRALRDPAPQVMVNRFDDSTVILNIRAWSKTDVFWEMRWDLARQVRQTLNDANCQLPLRTRELHVVSRK